MKIERNYRNLIIELIRNSDATFDKIGRNLPNTPQNILIEQLGYTSFHIAGAILLLTENKFNQEATILLRSLIENTINLKYILNKNTTERIRQFLRITSKISFGEKWTKTDLKNRMIEVGFKEEYYNKVIKITHSFSHTQAESLDWSNIKPDYPQFSEGAIHTVTYQMLGHILEVLYKHISKEFSLYKQVFKNIK